MLRKDEVQIQKGNDLVQGELILGIGCRELDQIACTFSLSALARRKMDGVQSVVHMGFN